MLKLIWTPGAAAAPDQRAYREAVDRLTASFAGASAQAEFPRAEGAGPVGLDTVAAVLRSWLAARNIPGAPVKLMLHGYDYDPRHAGDRALDPFELIYAYPGGTGPDPRLT